MEAGGVLRIIIVDDDEAMLKILRPRLEIPGSTEVVTALTPEQALAALPPEGTPLAVISDFNLKAERNGLQLLDAIARTHPHATRILISGYSADQIGIGSDERIHAFVEKDLRVENIVAPILRTLRARYGG